MENKEERTLDSILLELEEKLNTSGIYGVRYHPDSIMEYEKICNHDDGYLCEHRRQWIIDFLKTNLK